MPDYEDMILERQELIEIYEDEPDIYESLLDGSWWDDVDPEVFVCLYT